MQSNENPEMKDSLKMDDARVALTGPQPVEGKDNSTTTIQTAAAAEAGAVADADADAGDEVPASEIGIEKPSDFNGDMMPPPAVAEPRPPSSAASDKDDYESLSLQELAGRSSTPYTVQSVCCDNANCELGNTHSTTVSPVKEESPDGLELGIHKDDLVIEEGQSVEDDTEGRKYTRSDLMNIRDCMTIIRPECLGASRLKRLNLLRSENGPNNVGNVSGNKKNSYRASNSQNDLMPAFFKRKTAQSNGNTNSITYDTFKYTDSHAFGSSRSESGLSNMHRRIGSGRIQSNREVNWDYIPEEDPDRDNLPEFFNTKDTITSNVKLQQQRHAKKPDLDDNSNYVKRVISSVVGESSSSFRSGTSRLSNNSVGDDRHNTSNSGTISGNANKSDEPEWFSCGPTSRLDTIELCGFNETDQQEIRMEMSKGKNKPDLNNNSEESRMNGGVGGQKEKKHLAFQFDDFSTHSSKNGGSSNSAGNRMPGSKFLPLFNAKKREEEKTAKDLNASQSLNDFFKRSDLPAVLKEKMSLSEMPSVDEIEAKCRIQQQQKPVKPKPAPVNLGNNTEHFKKMLNQLNQNQAGGSGSLSSPSQPSPTTQQQTQPTGSLFNNDNISNFIKQRNLQQQLLQKQQQAAFAQFHLNNILSRPEAQMLLLSLARGEISKHGLIVQLSNPNLTPADREAITAVLTFSAGQYQQQLAVNTAQHQQFITNQLQHLALLQQQINKNTAAKRNVGANGIQSNGVGGSSPRTFSQEELQSHANLILQHAMMKKRLEEQTSLSFQKILQIQNSMNNGYIGGNNNMRTNNTLTGSKNQSQQQPQHQQHNRNRKGTSNGGNRGSTSRRRSTSSTSSSNTGINTTHMKLATDLEYRQLEQRRNTIATTNPTDEFLQIPQNI